MRIITGKLKGRKIPVPDTDALRPTSDRTKEGLFSVIAARRFFEGTTALDLFAGSGNLGFEAISRGTESVCFVDQNPEHTAFIESLALQFDVNHQITTLSLPVEKYLSGNPTPFDLIFSDPPYDYPFMEDIIETLITKGWLYPEGWLILEHDKRYTFSGHPHCFYDKSYGRTVVSIFQAQTVDFD